MPDKSSFKNAVRAATTANITLSGLQTVDGVVLAAGDRVLVKNQSLGKDNGIYVVHSSAWKRPLDADRSVEFPTGTLVLVTDGGQALKIFALTTVQPIELGVTALTFSEIHTNGDGTDVIADVDFTISGPEAGNYIPLTIQLLDANGDPITFVATVAMYLADDASGATPNGANFATWFDDNGSGGVISAEWDAYDGGNIYADPIGWIVSDANGVVEIKVGEFIDDALTQYAAVVLPSGKVVTSGPMVFADDTP